MPTWQIQKLIQTHFFSVPAHYRLDKVQEEFVVIFAYTPKNIYISILVSGKIDKEIAMTFILLSLNRFPLFSIQITSACFLCHFMLGKKTETNE